MKRNKIKSKEYEWEEFIKDWFYSDLNIEIEISKGKQKGLIILENNAYYYNGIRHKGDKRTIIYDSDYDIEKDEIYEFLENNFKDYFYKEYSLEEIINFLIVLENNNFKLKVL